MIVGASTTTVEQRVNPLYNLTTESTASSSIPAAQPSSRRASALHSMMDDTAQNTTAAVFPGERHGVDHATTPSTAVPSTPLQRRLSVQPHVMLRHSVEKEHDAAMLGTSTESSSLEAPRIIHTRPYFQPLPNVASNRVVTAKYNIVTFLPIFLFEMFSRVAYLYFLFQASLAWWRTVSPFGGVGSTMALLFVLVVGALKALWEDRKRHQEDARTNASIAHWLRDDGTVVDIAWKDVQVGQILLVRDGERMPADVLCLHADLPERVCFVKTTNLDGETNLKIKKPVDLKGIPPPSTPQDLLQLNASVYVEAPSADLHVMRGKVVVHASGGQDVALPVTMNEMLLRGCVLANSKQVAGLVVYTGKETRIQKNSAKTPLKVGSFDRFLNMQILMIICMQFALCISCTAASQWWKTHQGVLRPYLALDVYVEGNYKGVVGVIITFLTFWLLFSYLVPISLFVTMEIVKFWQGFVFVNNDPHMVDPTSHEHAKARNSGLNEDLGKVEYVFSDKTGTLTANEMQLRMISVQARVCGRLDWRLEDNKDLPPANTLTMFDQTTANALRALRNDQHTWQRTLQAGGSVHDTHSMHSMHHDSAPQQGGASLNGNERGGVHGEGVSEVQLGIETLEFWMTVLVCQSLVVEPSTTPGGKSVYQGPSPDEVALVEGARQLGFEFIARSMTHVTLCMLGDTVEFEILNVFEFSSERGRMSVIARTPDGSIRIYSKGADAKMLPLLHPTTHTAVLLSDVQNTLHVFATKGLRTLLLATRQLSPHTYNDWDTWYQSAASQLEGREVAMSTLMKEVEQGLQLVGCTGIEDKLQDGVPEAINTLLSARIKVWMITGDKQETAINIGVSCKLIHNPDALMICNADSPTAAAQRLQHLLSVTNTPTDTTHHASELVIDGNTLTHILGTPHEPLLAALGSGCHSVIVCRASPSQKAAIVKLMTEWEMQQAEGGAGGALRWLRRRARRQQGKMLAIGDGANDVAMIQAADIGVGIMGKEGRQAVNNSDFAIGQFRFLTRLLLVHGTLCHYRLARLIKYSFYKNIIFAYVLFFFQLFCGFSGQSLIDGIPAAVYNVFFTSLPILLFALLDRPVRDLTTLEQFPQLYRRQHSLTSMVFWVDAVFLAIVDAATVFFLPYFAMTVGGQGSTTDVYSLGKIMYIGLLGVITLEIIIVARYWTWLWGAAVIGSYLVVFPFVMLYPRVQVIFGIVDPSWYGPPDELLTTPWFWLVLITVYAITAGSSWFVRLCMWLYRQQDSMIVSEIECKQQKTLTAKRGVPQATLLVDTTSSAVVSPPAVISQPHTSSVEVEHAAVHQGVAGVAVRRNSKVHPEGVQLHIGVGRSQQECRVGCVHSVVKDHTIHIGTCVQEVGTVNETVL